MAIDDPIRASDTDREVVVAALREAYTAGRLTMDEFNDRMAAAYASRTWGDLRKLTVDLPVQPVLGSDIPGRVPEADGAASSTPAPAPDQELKPGEEQPLQPDMRRRRSPVGILIPFVIVMLLATHGFVGPGVIFLVIIIAALASILGSIRR
ncbi:MAG TPA: DUF1707 domain-containing protein [Trebonia sp.]|nr:DUF1707 domain-containing protein [Trebonia sp.]